jgi:hypothetical protein
MEPVQIQSEVGSDGVLLLQVPLGEEHARMPVVVTIVGLEDNGRPVRVTDWRQFVRETYGSCASLGLEEPMDLPLQDRTWDG